MVSPILHGDDNRSFIVDPSSASANGFPADVGAIDFHDTLQGFAHRVDHRFAQTAA